MMAKFWAKVIGAVIGLLILCSLIYFIIWWAGPTNPRVIENPASTIGLSPKFEPSPGMPVAKPTVVTISFPWWGWLTIGLAALAYMGIVYWLWTMKTRKNKIRGNQRTLSPSP
jgi:hypothetical protein